MQLNSLPQIYEIVVTQFIDKKLDCDPAYLNIQGHSFKIACTTVNNVLNTISYTLYFSDMISQTNFIQLLPTNHYKYSLKGLLYLESTSPSLEYFING